MGLFDRLRDDADDEEVELRPPGHRSQRSSPSRSGSWSAADEVELQDTAQDDDEFILPGYSPGGQQPAESPSRDRGRQRSSGRDRDDRIDDLLQQNERIIRLLEDLTGESADRSSGDEQAIDDMW